MSDPPLMEIGENTLGIWYVSMDGCDWLAHLARHGERFEFVYRFRYYVDKEPFEGKDHRSWTRVEMKPHAPESHALGIARFAFERLIAVTGAVRHWELMRGGRSAEEFAEVLTSMPGIHAKYEIAPLKEATHVETQAPAGGAPGPGQYQCAHCGGVFNKGRSDEVALAEAEARMPDVPRKEWVMVCDNCYVLLTGGSDPLKVARRTKE